MPISSQNDDRINHLVDLERRRCAALVEKDIATVRAMVTPDYAHVHGNGQVDDYAAYFSMLDGPIAYISMDRRDLTVRIYGDAAVMAGVLAIRVKPGADADPVALDYWVQQVWVAQDGAWRTCAYQATALS